MCGISGIFSAKVVKSDLVIDSIDEIAHRGPDERGFFRDGICQLGMCRLAIVDVLSGQQPNYNANRTIVSVFNGEIYNFLKLRKLLVSKGYQINTRGDSALIPFLYEEFGKDFPRKLQGMFSIAVYDLNKEKILLVRDRIGKKPLWYSFQGGVLAFSSEIKGLIKLGIKKTFDEGVIPEYLQYGYINSPRSPYVEIKSLEPATLLISQYNSLTIEKYWNSVDITPLNITFEEAKAETRRLLKESIQSRLVSERPVGAFLSGGIDSTIVTSLMRELSESPVHSFSIGFQEKKFDESKYAVEVSKSIGTIHHEKIVNADPVFILSRLSETLDQPFADSSIIPTFLLAEFASQEVVVALSGDGGDEVFGGYDRYRAGIVLDDWNFLLHFNPARVLPSSKMLNQRLRKLVSHSGPSSLAFRYKGLQSLFQEEDLKSILNSNLLRHSHKDYFFDLWNSIPYENRLRKMQEVDINSYLPGDLMYKVDMASMANSLEVRSPFLDYRLVEFGLALPSQFKIKNGETKHLLREIARELVPRNLIDRPKMGFAIPRGKWLRFELNELVHDTLLSRSFKSRGWFVEKKIDKILYQHQHGHNLDHLIWPILMLELWARNWLD